MAAEDLWAASDKRRIMDPFENAAVVTPSDSADLAYATRGLFIGSPGNIKITTVGGQTVTMTGMPSGMYPLRVTRVHSTSTTASNIVALW